MENFWFYIWVVVLWLLISQRRWLYVSSYPSPSIKNLSAKIAKLILLCWERSSSIYIWLKVFKKFFGDDFLFPAPSISLLAVQLYRVRHKIFWLCQCWYTISNTFFLRSFSPSLVSLLTKVLSVCRHKFFILKFYCFMFLLNFITSK